MYYTEQYRKTNLQLGWISYSYIKFPIYFLFSSIDSFSGSFLKGKLPVSWGKANANGDDIILGCLDMGMPVTSVIKKPARTQEN